MGGRQLGRRFRQPSNHSSQVSDRVGILSRIWPTTPIGLAQNRGIESHGVNIYINAVVRVVEGYHYSGDSLASIGSYPALDALRHRDRNEGDRVAPDCAGGAHWCRAHL